MMILLQRRIRERFFMTHVTAAQHTAYQGRAYQLAIAIEGLIDGRDGCLITHEAADSKKIEQCEPNGSARPCTKRNDKWSS
jgi:hypothetical protein